MKKNLLLLSFTLVVALTHAQIPNPSFENWTGGDPDQWFTSNIPGFALVTQVTTAHAGSSAARCDVQDIFGFSFPGVLSLGPTGTGVHTATAPQAIHGWYIMNSDSDDYEIVAIGMWQNNDSTGGGGAFLTNTSVYKEFVANVYYFTGSPNGDSIIMVFLMSNASGFVHDASYFIVDDLSLGLPSGIGDLNNGTYEGLESISPNPGGDVSQIIYDIRETGNTVLRIYDVTGKMVEQLVNEKQSPGRYKALADLTGLAAGTYICRLTTGIYTDVSKLIVAR
jgi:hypothetical protein